MNRTLAVILLALMLLVPSLAQASESQPAVIGPVLISTLPRDAVLVTNEVSENGDYVEQLITSDGLASITLARRQAPTSAQAILAEWYPEARDITEQAAQPVASYPAAHLTFTTGENEDTRIGDLVVFSTDTHTFIFLTDVAADAYGELAGDERYDELVAFWIESLDLFDSDQSCVIGAPFYFEDAIGNDETGLSTVAEYVNAMDPIAYEWAYEGAATGGTRLTMRGETGSITVVLYAEDGVVSGQPDGQADALDDQTLSADCWLSDVFWDEGFAAIPTVHNLAIGDSVETVLGSFPHGEDPELLYDITALNPEADASWLMSQIAIGGVRRSLEDDESGYDEVLEYVTCNLVAPDEWREYYTLSFFFAEGKLRHMSQLYSSDAE